MDNVAQTMTIEYEQTANRLAAARIIANQLTARMRIIYTEWSYPKTKASVLQMTKPENVLFKTVVSRAPNSEPEDVRS